MIDYVAVVPTPLPDIKLGIRQAGGAIFAVDFLPGATASAAPRDALAVRAAEALGRYFEDSRYAFSLPLKPQGTSFQQRVWRALMDLDPGQTVSYGTLARRLGSAARAVGAACRANPIPLIVPCHRVVAAAGLGGYGGQVDGGRLAIKRWLLEHEGAA